jgi:hypothetical protein
MPVIANFTASTSLVVIEGYKQTPPEPSDDVGCKLKTVLKNATTPSSSFENSDWYGSKIRPTASMDYKICKKGNTSA